MGLLDDRGVGHDHEAGLEQQEQGRSRRRRRSRGQKGEDRPMMKMTRATMRQKVGHY